MAAAAGGLLGGGALGGILGIVGMVFPPAAIASAAANLVGSAIGGAVNGVIDFAMKSMGMPGFIGKAMKSLVDGALKQLTQGADQQVLGAVKDKVGDRIKKFQDELMKDITDAFQKYRSDAQKNGKASGGKASGKSWFVAMAMALGEIQNKQAEKVKKLAEEVSKELGSDDAKSGKNQQAQFDKMEELKAEAKLQEAITSMCKSCLDSIGNALNTAARSQ